MHILQTAKLVFYPISQNNTFIDKKHCSPKYVAGTLAAGIFPSEIYTLDEISKAYPEIERVELSSKSVVPSNA